jgi:hypothetical protein
MVRSFEDLLNEAWNRLEPLRDSTNDEPLMKWQKLCELTSENGILKDCPFMGKASLGKRRLQRFTWRMTRTKIAIAFRLGGKDTCLWRYSLAKETMKGQV